MYQLRSNYCMVRSSLRSGEESSPSTEEESAASVQRPELAKAREKHSQRNVVTTQLRRKRHPRRYPVQQPRPVRKDGGGFAMVRDEPM